MQDVNSATNVHHNLQGAVIPSSGAVGMRIQYPSIILLFHNLIARIARQFSFFYSHFSHCFILSIAIYFIFSVSLLTLRYIFEKPVWEKEGLRLPRSSPECERSSSSNHLPVARRGCISFLKHCTIGCIMLLLHASHSSSSHQHQHLFIYNTRICGKYFVCPFRYAGHACSNL